MSLNTYNIETVKVANKQIVVVFAVFLAAIGICSLFYFLLINSNYSFPPHYIFLLALMLLLLVAGIVFSIMALQKTITYEIIAHEIRKKQRDIEEKNFAFENQLVRIKEIAASNEQSFYESKEITNSIANETDYYANGILRLLDFLTNKNTTPQQQSQYYNLIQKYATMMSLSLKDIATNKKNLSVSAECAFSALDLLEETAFLLSAHAEEKNNEFITKLSPDLPLNLFGNPYKISQALIGICVNAINRTQDGRIVVEIFGRAEQDILHLECRVCDTGEDILPKIEDFHDLFANVIGIENQNEYSAKQNIEIIEKRIKLNGGNFTIEKTMGTGNILYFSFPCKVL